jgi:hypothetical protein
MAQSNVKKVTAILQKLPLRNGAGERLRRVQSV